MDKNKQPKEAKNNGLYTLLGVVKICPFTGKKYDAVRKVKCTCECHNPNVTIMHFMPCCDGGYIEEFRYIE